MKRSTRLLISFLVAWLVWCAFSWPLPRYVNEGIPMAHHGAGDHPVRYMEAGDHLQLLYYFWLFRDMVGGGTPWLTNPYEFNTGHDDARRQVEPYYAPFSWVYTVLDPMIGRAFAYNMAAWASIWFTYLFSWLLLRRYVRSEWITGCMAVIAIALPYRWFALLGGSPTGFGMAMTPLLLWGLDRAVRDPSRMGGVWAGIAIVFSYASDLHVFFFNVLLTPAWCLVAFAQRPAFDWKRVLAYRNIALALLPVLIATLLVVLASRSVASDLAETHMVEGRSVGEVMMFSPQRNGFLQWSEHHLSSQVFVGYTVLALLFAGGLAVLWRYLYERPRAIRPLIVYGLLCGGFLLIALLALGPHGPRAGFVYMKARQWIPEYDMIRQAGKVFAVLPPILALLSALACAHIVAVFARRRDLLTKFAILPVVLMALEYGRRMDPPICLLAEQQAAYAAVAADAADRNRQPHVLIVTLWPGDAHFASSFQYYCSLYRIRMINGYTPAISSVYFDEVFLRFKSINHGWMTDEQADELLERGIPYLIVHEDLFPEKVSPFPIAHTLSALNANPRLHLLKQDGPIWAFRILAEADRDAISDLEMDYYFSARHWLFQHQPHEAAEVREDAQGGRGHYLALLEAGATTRTCVTDAPPVADLRWMIRARGQGILQAHVMADDLSAHTETLVLDTPEWAWFNVSMPIETHVDIALHLELESGTADVCSALLTAGRSIQPAPGETVVLPAAWFFHAGYLDPETKFVHYRQDFDRSGPVFYGPKLPLEPGRYEIMIDFDTNASAGTRLGSLQLEQLFSDVPYPAIPIYAGEAVQAAYTLHKNLPINAIIDYSGKADLTVKTVLIKRLVD